MKKMMIMLALVLTVTTTFAHKGKEAVNSQALTAFKSEFAGATDVAWTVNKNYYKVAFTIDNQKQFAFYDNQGEFIAITRFISSTQLPIELQTSRKKSFSNYWVTDLFEITNGDESAYYITLENADGKIVLKSAGNHSWSLYQKSEKI